MNSTDRTKKSYDASALELNGKSRGRAKLAAVGAFLGGLATSGLNMNSARAQEKPAEEFVGWTGANSPSQAIRSELHKALNREMDVWAEARSTVIATATCPPRRYGDWTVDDASVADGSTAHVDSVVIDINGAVSMNIQMPNVPGDEEKFTIQCVKQDADGNLLDSEELTARLHAVGRLRRGRAIPEAAPVPTPGAESGETKYAVGAAGMMTFNTHGEPSPRFGAKADLDRKVHTVNDAVSFHAGVQGIVTKIKDSVERLDGGNDPMDRTNLVAEVKGGAEFTLHPNVRLRTDLGLGGAHTPELATGNGDFVPSVSGPVGSAELDFAFGPEWIQAVAGWRGQVGTKNVQTHQGPYGGFRVEF